MPKTTVLQANQTQFFSSKRLFISKIIMPITSTAVAVMFTFSFSSAFAATDLTTVVESNAEAVKAITDKADGYLADITTDLNKLVSEYNSFTGKNDISKEAYTAVLEDLAETAANTVKTQKVNALNELAAAEKAITDANQSILGYIVKDGFGTVDPG